MNAPLPSLDDRIAEALATETPSQILAALLSEARQASERAANRYSAERMTALDPVTPRNRVADARQGMADAEFDAERLKAATMALERRHEQARASEQQARTRADFENVKAERDALAEDLRRDYPELVGKLVDLLSRVVANDREIARVGTNSGSHLVSAEVEARGGRSAFNPNDPMIPKLTGATLPAFEPGWQMFAWNGPTRGPTMQGNGQ